MKPMSGVSYFFGILKIALSLFIIAGFGWLILNRQGVMDWWQLRQYKPSSEAVALASADTMQGRGRDLFYLSDPKVQDAEAFNLSCRDIGEQGSVLGCYSMQHIYIYNVTDDRLPNVKEVTAAHEMLHAAYDRLDSATKQHVDAMVQAEADKRHNDVDLQKMIKLYQKTEPGQVPNELHSILGTEYSDLSPELESYYSTYFSDRSKIVGFAQSYKQVFDASRARIVRYDEQLAMLRQQIQIDEADLKTRKAGLDAARVELDSLRHSDVEAYNRAVPAYNLKVNEFNALASDYNATVRTFNDLVVKRNKEAAAQNDLYHSLDSQYQKL